MTQQQDSSKPSDPAPLTSSTQYQNTQPEPGDSTETAYSRRVVNKHRLHWQRVKSVPTLAINPLAATGKYAQLEYLFSRHACFICEQRMWCKHRDIPAWEAELECEARRTANGK